ncbi:MAG: hypothetical protein AAF439_15300 [Pseudomonadota bacterium]
MRLLFVLVIIAITQSPLQSQAQVPCLRDAPMAMFAYPSGQNFEIVRKFPVDGGDIAVATFSPLAGRHAKLFAFYLIKGGCFVEAVTLGSYDKTVEFMRESQQIGPDERIYHLDHYTPRSHSPMGFFKEPPTIDDVIGRAVAALR